MLRCKNCGGNLVFDIKKQNVKCVFCGSEYAPEDYTDDRGADEYVPKEGEYRGQAEASDDDTFETVIYTCTQCGAELVSPADAAVGYCSFCGTEAVLQSRVAREKRPAHIIPFRYDKERCKELYLAEVAKQPYPPAEFKDPAFIDKFRGIYIPYWEYDVGFTKKPTLKFKETYSDSSYNYTNEYEITPQLPGFKVTVPFDASVGFDDSLAAAIAPFDRRHMKPFSPGYLAGFFADTATASSELYEKEAVRLGQDRALEGMAEGFKGGSVEISPDTAKRQEILGTCVTDQTSEMCPVWFLTWRKGQRLAYAVINGETGKLFAEIPVDIKAFMIRTLLIAAVLFVIFTLFAPLILPYTAAAISSVMALIVQLIYRHEMRELYDREKNLDNLGAFSNAPETEVRKVMKQREKRGLKLAGCIIPFIAFLNFIVVSAFLNDGKTGALICTFFVSFCGIIVWLMSLKTGFGIKEKDMLLGITLPVIAQLAAFAVVAAKPVPDWPYYIAAGGGLAATLLTALSMLFRYNELCTRGVPDFHDRKGGAKYEAG